MNQLKNIEKSPELRKTIGNIIPKIQEELKIDRIKYFFSMITLIGMVCYSASESIQIRGFGLLIYLGVFVYFLCLSSSIDRKTGQLQVLQKLK